MSTTTNGTDATSAPRRIVVVGGGIAGAETALTLALGLPRDTVTLVERWPSMRVLPDLVYVPFGVSPRRLDMPLDALGPAGVEHVQAEVLLVNADTRTVHTTDGAIEFDVLVVAPGAQPVDSEHRSLRSLDDALRLRRELAEVVRRAAAGERRTITIRAASDDAWTAPACELAMLTGAWIRSQRLDHLVDTMLVTSDTDPFEWFGPLGEATVEAALRRARVQVAAGVPSGRFDELGGDVVVDFGPLEARRVDGLPGHGASGWYETNGTFEVAPGIHVVGDAVSLPYRAGFASAWQARRVLAALDGSLDQLGPEVDGIPIASVEYQMDLADGTLHARLGNADALAHPFLGHDADVRVVPGTCPDKLAGLLVHERILIEDPDLVDAPLAFRDLLRSRAAA